MSKQHDSPDTPSPLDEEMAFQIYHSVNEAIFVHDAESGAIVDVNETMCEMYGYTRAEARKLSIEDLSSEEPPYTQEHAVEYVQQAAEGEPQVFDWHARDSDGNLFWVEVSMRRTFVDDEMYILVIARDITERKQRERELEHRNQKLQLLNRIVRHDIRNDMDAILNFAPHVEEALEDEQATEHLERMVESGQHVVELTDIVGDLMKTALSDGQITEAIPVVDVLQEEIVAVRSLDEAVVIDGPEDRQSLDVLADSMLGTVFRNLLTNAVRHNDTENPAVDVSVTETDDEVVIRIADNGPGIPDVRKDEVFGRGEKGADSFGTGVGLYLVDTLVDGYGGAVRVEDNNPCGSIFVVELEKPSQQTTSSRGDWLGEVSDD